MNTTSVSLLDRLRRAGAQSADWQRLLELYQPVIQTWLRRVPELGNETADLTQEVLVVLFRELPSFDRRRDGSFRAWLRQITLNRIRSFRKTSGKRLHALGGEAVAPALAQLADSASDLARQWDQDHDRYVIAKLLDLVRPDFHDATWQAFSRCALKDEPPAQVAAGLGISVGAVVQAKHRVLKRLREEAGDFLDV